MNETDRSVICCPICSIFLRDKCNACHVEEVEVCHAGAVKALEYHHDVGFYDGPIRFEEVDRELVRAWCLISLHLC